MPRTASNNQHLEKGVNAFSLRASRGNQLCQHLGFDFCERIYFTVYKVLLFSVPKLVVTCYSCREKPIQHLSWGWYKWYEDTQLYMSLWPQNWHTGWPDPIPCGWSEWGKAQPPRLAGEQEQASPENKTLQRKDGTEVQDVLLKVTL